MIPVQSANRSNGESGGCVALFVIAHYTRIKILFTDCYFTFLMLN